MATFMISGALLFFIVLIILKMRKKKKGGEYYGCSGNCQNCHSKSNH